MMHGNLVELLSCFDFKVRQDGLALKFAIERLHNNRAIVMAAVKQNGWALRYASDGSHAVLGERDHNEDGDDDTIAAEGGYTTKGGHYATGDRGLRGDVSVVNAAVHGPVTRSVVKALACRSEQFRDAASLSVASRDLLGNVIGHEAGIGNLVGQYVTGASVHDIRKMMRPQNDEEDGR